MKQELPIAVTLLAAGCLLWFFQTTRSSDSGPNIESGASNGEIRDDALLGNQIVGEIDSSSHANGTPGSAGISSQNVLDKTPTASDHPFIHSVSNGKTVQFLASVSKQLADSRPFQSSVRLTGNMFGQSISAHGNYYQMGQGSHKSRIQLTFGDTPDSPSVSQLCDGRFVYNIQSNLSDRSFEFVDLKRIRRIKPDEANQFLPAGWIATGGVSSLIQQLNSAFNFGPPILLENSDIVLRGSWNIQAIHQVVNTIETNAEENLPFEWSDIPAQLPHAVEIVFAKDQEFNHFPKSITYFKFVENDPTQVTPAVDITFTIPKLLHNATDQFFVVDSSNLESVDVTDQYIAKIQEAKKRGKSNVRSY